MTIKRGCAGAIWRGLEKKKMYFFAGRGVFSFDWPFNGWPHFFSLQEIFNKIFPAVTEIELCRHFEHVQGLYHFEK